MSENQEEPQPSAEDALKTLAAEEAGRDGEALKALAARQEAAAKQAASGQALVPVSEDALKVLAGGEERVSEDALKALADGEDLAPASPPEGQDEEAPIETDEVLPGMIGAEAPEAPAIPGVATPISDVAARKALADRFHKLSAWAHHNQLKKFMIPLLIVVAVMLFVFGGLLMTMLPGGSAGQGDPAGAVPGDQNPGELLARPWAKLAVFASFPVGAVLLLGAWVFYHDVRRAEKK